MKKFIFILLLILLLIPYKGHAAINTQSPTIKNLYYFNPEIKFDFLDQHLTTLDLNYWEPFKILKEFDDITNWEEYHIDEEFILYLEEKKEVIELTLPLPYKLEVSVYGVLITEEEYYTVEQDIITKEGNTIFNLNSITGNVIVYIISNK